MNYTYATAQNATDALDARLYNQTYQFWTQAELLLYLREALRTFNALSQLWRAEMTFSLTANAWWYDLPSQVASLVPYTVNQSELIQVIENHLLEPPTTSYPLTWAGSTQFSISDILTALQSRQNDAVGTTACVINRSAVNAPLVPRTTLTGDVLDIRRVAWLPGSTPYVNKPLKQSDFYAERAFFSGYTTAPAQPPSTWMQNTEPPPSFDVDTVPPVAGQYDLLTTNTGPAWSAAADTLMNMPDDWTWVVKWGALEELLSRESNAKDVLRSEYAAKRYAEGMALLERAPMVLALRLNNIPMAVDSIRSADDFDPLWQAAVAAQPKSAYTARNLLAFSPKPDAAYSATVSVCQNAPVPTLLTDFIQVPQDCYDSVLDIAQHLAAFKLGGAEFLATVPLYQRAQRKAAQYNGKLAEMGFFSLPQLDLSQLQEQQGGRYLPGTGPEQQ